VFSTLNVVVFQSCLLSCLCVSGFVVDHHPTAIYIITITTFTTATTYTAAAAVMKFVSIVATLAAVTVPTTSFSVTPSGVGNHLRLRPAAVATSSALAVAADLGEIRKRTREERLEAASKGLQVHCVGLSIHHASVEVREKLAIAEADWNAASNQICEDGVVAEAAVLSTCNRFEVYYAATDPRAAMAHVTSYLANRSGLPVSVLRQNLFMLSGDDAVWHVMRVAGGLDSLIVGEGQILSQVRQCYLHSVEDDGCGGKVLARLLNNALAAGKRVRSETAIAKGSVSISSAAVELSEMLSQQDLQLPFSEARLAVVGAGKMTRLLVTHLASRGLERITIVNRSLGRPQELQEQFPDVDIEVKLMEDLWDVVGRSDIVYTATSAVDYVIDEQKLEANGLVGGHPLMLVDIAVPRNVGDDCKVLPNVAAYNVDDLKAVVAKNTAMRQREMLEAEDLLREETDAFVTWRESLSAIPTINQLQERANAFREEELKRCTRKLSGANLSEKELEAVERLSRGIVNKLLHGPMAHLRKTESVEGKQATLKELSAMFRLEEEEAANNGRRRRRS
jgi:glutamyl-tRNA reductase